MIGAARRTSCHRHSLACCPSCAAGSGSSVWHTSGTRSPAARSDTENAPALHTPGRGRRFATSRSRCFYGTAPPPPPSCSWAEISLHGRCLGKYRDTFHRKIFRPMRGYGLTQNYLCGVSALPVHGFYSVPRYCIENTSVSLLSFLRLNIMSTSGKCTQLPTVPGMPQQSQSFLFCCPGRGPHNAHSGRCLVQGEAVAMSQHHRLPLVLCKAVESFCKGLSSPLRFRLWSLPKPPPMIR